MKGLISVFFLILSAADLYAQGMRTRIEQIPVQPLPIHQSPLESAGMLILNVNVERAEVYINKEFKGRTPLGEGGIPLTPGAYRIELKKEGYKPWEKEVEIPEDGEASLTVFLQQSTGILILRINVQGADVSIDGRVIGTTPLREGGVALPIGKHIIEITKKGYLAWSREVEVLEEKEITLAASLQEKQQEREEPAPKRSPRTRKDDIFIAPSP